MIDETTPRGYKLPHPENIAKQDVTRIRESFVEVDADVSAIEAVVIENDKANKLKKFEDFIDLWSKK